MRVRDRRERLEHETVARDGSKRREQIRGAGREGNRQAKEGESEEGRENGIGERDRIQRPEKDKTAKDRSKRRGKPRFSQIGARERSKRLL